MSLPCEGPYEGSFWEPCKQRVKLVCPAPFSSVLEMGGATPFMRRALLGQRLAAETVACYGGDGLLLCVVMLKQWRARRLEFALMIKPRAAVKMLVLLRLARGVLCQMTRQAMLVFAHINPLNIQGQRMARLVGFRQGEFKDRSIWIFRGLEAIGA